MNKLFLLILILASNLFAQGWNDIVTTTINEPQKNNMFANSSGIHILLGTYPGNNIVYHRLNSTGTVDKTETLEDNGEFPNIVGTNDKIYAIYKTGNNIRVKYSTDNGSTWIWNSNLDRETTSNICNGVDAVYNDQGVHAVWGTRDSYPDFETYYARLTPDYSWVDYKNVTDYGTSQYGGNPNVVVTPNRVHVSFNTNATDDPGNVITRDKFYGT